MRDDNYYDKGDEGDEDEEDDADAIGDLIVNTKIKKISVFLYF